MSVIQNLSPKNLSRLLGICLLTLTKLIKLINPSLIGKTRIKQQSVRQIKRKHSSYLGFTLLEVLAVMLIAGVLSAIAAPSWLSFVNNQRLTSVQSVALSSLRLAQSNAKRSQSPWQISFRNTTRNSQYAVHPAPSTDQASDVNYWNQLPWQNFDENVSIVDGQTTFTKLSAVPEPDVYRVQFKAQGNPSTINDLGKITFGTPISDRRRCVIISTILGSSRTASDADCN